MFLRKEVMPVATVVTYETLFLFALVIIGVVALFR